MSVRVEWIDAERDFADLAPRWAPLLPADAHPFDEHIWLRTWWEAFHGDSQLQVCTAWRGDDLVAALPLRRVGGRLLGFENGHSPMCRPLAADSEAMAALGDAVAARKEGLEMRAVPAEDPRLAELRAALRRRRVASLVEPGGAPPFIDTRGDYETWRQENKHRWKAPIEKKWRKMERDHEAAFTMVEAPPDLGPELDEGLRLEASGWKGEEGTAIECSPDTALFYRRMAAAFQEADQLRFNWIVLDGAAISFDFCLLYGNRLYTLKSGMDEDYKSFAPGLVLRLAVIKRCFELGIDAHDLLGDEVGWKTRFASGNRPHLNLWSYPGPAGHLRRSYRATVRPRLKAAYRRWRPLPSE